MVAGKRLMRLGVSAIGMGYHIAAWRHPDASAGGNMELAHFIRTAQVAERGLFDMFFLADGVGIRMYDEPPGALSRSSKNVQFEPLTLLSALAMVTSRIGLIATASTTWNEPYHIARKFASLDHISGGRAGWNVVTSVTAQEARAYYADVKGRMAKYGRRPDSLKIMPGLMAIPGRTRQEAHDRYEVLQELIHPIVGLSAIAGSLGDLSAYPLDGPVPEPINP